MRRAFLPLGAIAFTCYCTNRKADELANCQIVSLPANPAPTGEAVTRCLMLQYNWDVHDALAAGNRYQVRLDKQSRLVAAAKARCSREAVEAERERSEAEWRQSAIWRVESTHGISKDSSLALWYGRHPLYVCP